MKPIAGTGSRGLFQPRRLLQPMLSFLAQGAAPALLSRTIAVGVVCAIFPFLGTTTALTFLAGLFLGMNQPILQTLNQLLGPVQLLFIPVFVRAGEWLWRADGESFSTTAMMRVWQEGTFGEFLAQFGQAGMHAFTAWAAAAPLIFITVHSSLRPMVEAFAARRQPGDSAR